MVQQGIRQTSQLTSSLRGLILPAIGVSSVMNPLAADINLVARNSGAASNALGVLGGNLSELTRPLSMLRDGFSDWLDRLPSWGSALTQLGLWFGGVTASIWAAIRAMRIFRGGGAAAGAARGAAAGAGAAAGGGLLSAAGVIGAGVAIGTAGLYAGARSPGINDWLQDARGNVAGFRSGLTNLLRRGNLGDPFSETGRLRLAQLYDQGFGQGQYAQRQYDESSFLNSLRAREGYFSRSGLETRIFGPSLPPTALPPNQRPGDIPLPPQYQINNVYLDTRNPLGYPDYERALNGGQPEYPYP